MDLATASRTMTVHRAGLICFALGVAVFLNTLGNEFCFDDLSAIEQNRDLRPKTPWSNLIWNDFWGTPMHVDGSHKSYRPLCVATFRLNYLLHELQPMGYHLVNVLLHGAVCYLYVQLCGVVFSGAVWPALIAGLLFAVHPIHTEAVASLVGRAELLAGVFFLCTLLSYRKALQNKGLTRARWLSLSLLLTVCAMLSKEQGITVTALCLTYDFFVAQKLDFHSLLKVSDANLSHSPKLRRFFKRGLLVGGVSLVAVVTRIWMANGTPSQRVINSVLNPPLSQDPPYRQLSWLYLTFVNSWLLLNPAHLSADWRFGVVPIITSICDSNNILTVLSIGSLLTFVLYGLLGNDKHHKVVLTATLMIILPFLPASNLFFPVGFVVAERVLYLPSMGFCMLVALGLWTLIKRQTVASTFVKVLLVYLLVVHSAKTYQRNRDWKSDSELFVSAITINPQNGKLYNNLGHEREARKDYKMAEKLFRTAASVQPDDIGAYINLGRALKALGQNKEAEQVYRKAVDMMPTGKSFRVAPNYISVYYNLANLIRSDSARMLEAYELYQKALSMKPDFVEAHMNKGDLLLRMNKSVDAKASFEKALRYNPEYTDAHYNLATALVQLGERKEAERSYKRALALDGYHVYSLLSLGTLLHEDGRLDEATEILERALRVQPDNIRATSQLAVVYLDQQKIEKSEEMLLRTLAIDPDYRSALYNLAVIHNHRKEYAEAMKLLKRLVKLHPNHVNGLYLLGDCLMRLDKAAEAESVYLEVLRRHPNHVAAMHNLGVVKASGGDFTNAIQLFSKVLELSPSHEAALKHITEARLQQMQQRERESTVAAGNRSSSRAQSHRMNTSNSSHHKRTS